MKIKELNDYVLLGFVHVDSEITQDDSSFQSSLLLLNGNLGDLNVVSRSLKIF